MKGGAYAPLFFAYLCSMNSLLLLRDTNQGLCYIPVESIQDVRRFDTTTIIIYTNIISYQDVASPEVLSYELYEVTGGGATQVQAIIDAWISAQKGNEAVVTVAFPFGISRVDRNHTAWA